MRDPAPPYANEGPHALWHVSENPSIERFAPHVSATAELDEPLVWAVDTRHLPFYWFPRDCPRGTFWADSTTDPYDAERLLGGSSRVHAIEEAWLERMRTTRRSSPTGFPKPAVRAAPGRRRLLGQPRDGRAARGTRRSETSSRCTTTRRSSSASLPNLWPLWNDVVASTLEFSGMRLRNAQPAK